MNTNKKSEQGQAIVIVAIVLVVLLAMTAVAIDGGAVYSDRRNAQNAADAAALAGALDKVNDRTNAQVLNTVDLSLQSNGYDPVNSDAAVTGPLTDFFGNYYLVTVTLTDTTPTYFAQIIYGGELKNVVTAIARARKSQPSVPGTAIMGMAQCPPEASLIGFAGGGGDGAISTLDGGIFVNSPEDASDPCSFDLPTSADSIGVDVEPGYSIYSIGSYNYDGEDKITPLPVVTDLNGGVPIEDPLAFLDEPVCPSSGACDSAGNCTPGNINASEFKAENTLSPGIYCINGDIRNEVHGTDVLLYFISGSVKITGNEDFVISGLTSGDYAGMAIFMSRSNTDPIELNGNGEYHIDGTVYHISGTVSAGGGGNAPGDYVIKGQLIAHQVESNGHGDFLVQYDAGRVVWSPATIELVR